MLVYNYYNLHTRAEVEETEKIELTRLCDVQKQLQGYPISEHFKHFINTSIDSEVGHLYYLLKHMNLRPIMRIDHIQFILILENL